MAPRKRGAAATAAPQTTTLKVRIAPFRLVLVDGRYLAAGEDVELPAKEGKALIVEGYAELSGPREKPRAKAERRPRDPSRRPLTAAAIERGEEERGG